MLQSHQVEELLCLACGLDRDTLIMQFKRFQHLSRFPVDFTDDFLTRQPVERLQHIFVALCLQNQKMPDLTTQASFS